MALALIIATFIMFVVVVIIVLAVGETDKSATVTASILILLFFAVFLGIPMYCVWAGIVTNTVEFTMMILFGIPAVVLGIAVSNLQKANKKIAELEKKLTPPAAANKPQ